MQGHMTIEAFVWAIAHLALYSQRRGLWACAEPQEGRSQSDEAVLTFCERVLVPMGTLLGLGDEEVLVAASVMDEPALATLLQRANKGMEGIFALFATKVGCPEPYKRGHWSVQAIKRFGSTFELAPLISLSSLQRLFQQCARFEAEAKRGVDGQMSFACFRLAFVIIAQRLRLHTGSESDLPVLCVANLLVRLSALSKSRDASDLMAAARAALPAVMKYRPVSGGAAGGSGGPSSSPP